MKHLSHNNARTLHTCTRYAVALVAVSAVPATLYGQTTIQSILTAITSALSPFVTVAFGVAFVIFVWTVVLFIRKSGDDKELSVGRRRLMWGVFGLFLIVSLWGIVAIIQTITGVDPKYEECKSPTVGGGSGYDLKSCF